VVTEKSKLTFPVLGDFSNAVVRRFGIVFRVGDELQTFSKNVCKSDIAMRNGRDSYELQTLATHVIDTAGRVNPSSRLAYRL
jgi:hypothetical protein